VRLVVANHSTYPRVGDSVESQRLRRAYARLETGELSREGYEQVARDYIAEICREQADAGCDLVTDGQVTWYDAVSHLGARLSGIRVDGLRLAPDHEAASSCSPRPVKVVLTGPYTLARHTESPLGLEELTEAYAAALREELPTLRGAPLVQVEEPSLLRHPEHARLVRRALQGALDVPRPPVSLVTYFGDAAPLYEELMDMPVDMVGLDLTYAPGLLEVIERRGARRAIALGAVDGRNTKLEGDEVLRAVERVAAVLEREGIGEMHVQPSCGLEYLPRESARRKLARLRELVAPLQAVGETGR
jgi:5-methyltetrahydropteroyltriglutamate--homocysteine methyltransferase